MRPLVALLALLSVGAPALGRAAQPSVVILPFDNFSGDDDATRDITALVARRIAERGWRVVTPESIEPLLEKERVRYLDSLEPAMLKRVADAAGAGAVLSGTVYTYSAGRNPIVALSARMVRADGTLLWGDVAGLAAEETETLLGFGRKTTAAGVAGDTVDALMRHFPRGDEPALVRGKRKPMFRAGPLSYRVKDDGAAAPRRLCVLPFENTSAPPESARVIADILALRLAAGSRYEVVEPAMLRAAALKAGIASFRGATTDDLARLATVVGTPLFLRGTIFTYDDTTVHLELSLVDVAAKRVLWSAQHDRQGSDYTGLLMRGAATNAVALADRVIAEVVDTSGGK
jgi:TolB-like protein